MTGDHPTSKRARTESTDNDCHSSACCEISFELGPNSSRLDETTKITDPMELYALIRQNPVGELAVEQEANTADENDGDDYDKEDDRLFCMKMYEMCLDLFDRQSDQQQQQPFAFKFYHAACCIDFGVFLDYMDDYFVKGVRILQDDLLANTSLTPAERQQATLRLILANIYRLIGYFQREIDPHLLNTINDDDDEEGGDDCFQDLPELSPQIVGCLNAISETFNSSSTAAADKQQQQQQPFDEHLLRADQHTAAYQLYELLVTYAKPILPADLTQQLQRKLETDAEWSTLFPSIPQFSTVFKARNLLLNDPTAAVDNVLVGKLQAVAKQLEQRQSSSLLCCAAYETLGHLLMQQLCLLPADDDNDEEVLVMEQTYESAIHAFEKVLELDTVKQQDEGGPGRRVWQHLEMIRSSAEL